MSVFADLASDLVNLPGAIGCSPDEIALVKRLYTFDPNALTTHQLKGDAPHIDVSGRITSALSRILDAVTSETTLILLIEDLHWADEPSRRTLAALTTDRKQRRLLIIATSRNPVELDLPEAYPVDTIQLGGLSHPEAHELARLQISRLGVDDGIRDQYANAAVRLGGGNPFALLSLTHHFAITKTIDAVPPQLHQLVAAQLRPLPEAARQVLVAVTVLDRHATVERVKLALELPTHALVSGIADLERRGLIAFRDSRITPPHALMVATLLATEPDGALAVVRRSVAQLLSEEAERAGDARLHWAAADHWRQAGHPEKSVETLTRCAEHGISIGATSDVMSVLRQLQTLAPHTATSGAIDHVCSLLTQTPHLWGDLDTSLSLTAEGAGSVDLTQLRLLEVAAVHAISGSVVERIDWLRSVVADHERTPNERIRAAMNALVECEQTLDVETAHWVHKQVRRHLQSAAAADEARSASLIYHSTFGDLDTGVALARATIADLASGSASYSELRSVLNAANVLERAGLLQEAIAATETAYRRALAAQSAGSMQRAASSLGYLYRGVGDGEASDEWLAVSAELGCQSQASAYRNAHFHAAALRALDLSDYDAANDYLTHLDARPPARTKSLQWALIEALRIHIAVGKGMAIPDEDLQALSEWSLVAARWHPQDDVAAAICLCQRSKHGDTGADSYISDYEQARRKTAHPRIPWDSLRPPHSLRPD